MRRRGLEATGQMRSFASALTPVTHHLVTTSRRPRQPSDGLAALRGTGISSVPEGRLEEGHVAVTPAESVTVTLVGLLYQRFETSKLLCGLQIELGVPKAEAPTSRELCRYRAPQPALASVRSRNERTLGSTAALSLNASAWSCFPGRTIGSVRSAAHRAVAWGPSMSPDP
jgi:hypothetical protein